MSPRGVDSTATAGRIETAARIWAAATAARNGDREPAAQELARGRITEVVVDVPGALPTPTAADDGEQAVAPALDTGAELRHLGVDVSSDAATQRARARAGA